MNLQEILGRLRAEAAALDEAMRLLGVVDQATQERIQTISVLVGNLGAGQSEMDVVLMILADAASHAGQARGLLHTSQQKMTDYLQRF